MTKKFKVPELFLEFHPVKRENASEKFEPYQFCYLSSKKNPKISSFVISLLYLLEDWTTKFLLSTSSGFLRLYREINSSVPSVELKENL